MPLHEIRHLLDPAVESVKPFQVAVYTGYLGAGIHATCTGEIPNAVGQILGPAAHLGWVALLIVGPLATFVGIPIARRTPRGLWLQIAGDAGVASASLIYVVALSQTVYAGRASFAIWVVLALAICAGALVVRNVRVLRAVARVVRRLE
ncbi:hypothetical protein IU436_25450 [Nocardia farcinica]|uniref:hypothetical protein n=1 Tax=Nocardia farcinica TaxID=37329 RepID=UPI0018931144|nr:hypothetical protein [Nocardia farcinica]MBF6315058.1 hypothetical protein [Nocardia farcinica]MBF6422039.1 hypothetical protein [Nocardia farcinica]MBF6433696.1 hypothetical protein [Nocardia farcinica]MBF6504686.1 hypothetical protein [Nocardia farcinica]